MARPSPTRARPLWQLTVRTTLAAESAVVALLEAVYQQTPCICWDLQRQVNAISVYLQPKAAHDARRFVRLRAGLRALRESATVAPRTRASLRRVPAQDWSESWKRHFRPLQIGKLWVLPSWSRRVPPRDSVVITLDPGLSFGTGQHPTTRFCLEWLVKLRRAGASQALLDVGTGSGILAVAGARLGYAPVRAIDLDQSCVRTTRENAARNGVSAHVQVETADLARWSPPRAPFPVVCANLTADVLRRHAGRLGGFVGGGGSLLLAGILRAESRVVAEAFRAFGFEVRHKKPEAEWTSLRLVRGRVTFL